MKYMLLIKQPGDIQDFEHWPDDKKQAAYAGYAAVNNTPGVSPGERMAFPESATTVKVEGGKTLTTDGPFVELKDAVGGYLFFEADDLDAAIALAAKIPAASQGGEVEIRPLLEAAW